MASFHEFESLDDMDLGSLLRLQMVLEQKISSLGPSAPKRSPPPAYERVGSQPGNKRLDLNDSLDLQADTKAVTFDAVVTTRDESPDCLVEPLENQNSVIRRSKADNRKSTTFGDATSRTRNTVYYQTGYKFFEKYFASDKSAKEIRRSLECVKEHFSQPMILSLIDAYVDHIIKGRATGRELCEFYVSYEFIIGTLVSVEDVDRLNNFLKRHRFFEGVVDKLEKFTRFVKKHFKQLVKKKGTAEENKSFPVNDTLALAELVPCRSPPGRETTPFLLKGTPEQVSLVASQGPHRNGITLYYKPNEDEFVYYGLLQHLQDVDGAKAAFSRVRADIEDGFFVECETAQLPENVGGQAAAGVQ